MMYYVSRFFKLVFLMGFVLLFFFFFVCVFGFITVLVFTILFLGVLLVFVACDFFFGWKPHWACLKNRLLQIKRLIIILHALLTFVVLVVIVHIPFRWRFKMI